jgi:hypothetical protein
MLQSPFFLIFPSRSCISNQAGKQMSHADKVEVMDFLINVLKDHEKSLDTLISRAEDLLNENQTPHHLIQSPPKLKISLKNWDDFRDRSLDSELVCFDLLDSTFYCDAITENKIYQYTEETPDITLELENNNNLVLSGLKMNHLDEQFSLLNGQLSIGLELYAKRIRNSGEKQKIQYNLDAIYTKNWLSRELGIHRDYIVQGNITH